MNKKAIKSYIEFELQHYADTIQELNEIKEFIIDSTAPKEEGHAKYKFASQTESKAIKIITDKRIKNITALITAIDKARAKNEESEIVFKLHFLKGFDEVKTCLDGNISTRTFYRRKKEIGNNVVWELGLANIDEEVF